MRIPNDTERWKEHRRSKRCQSAKGDQQFLTKFFKPSPSATATSQHSKPRAIACPGLGHAQDSRIPKYLARTPVPSGGAPRRDVLHRQVLNDYARLRTRRVKPTSKQIRSRVLAQERALCKWVNHHTTGVVTSAKCEKRGRLSPEGKVLPCHECLKILRLKIFRNALRKPAPPRGRAKFTPKDYRNPVAGEAYLRHKDVQELMEMVSALSQRTLVDYRFTELPLGQVQVPVATLCVAGCTRAL
ncbi:hypothetical protein C8Q73DRAFT_216179 [Cubamyces lactineus]|nr:hypothetical protein C8Q73DRAFT_216179 [Cubamyces lactineus]